VNLRYQFVQAFLVTGRCDDLDALGGKRLGACRADAGGRASDDCGFSS